MTKTTDGIPPATAGPAIAMLRLSRPTRATDQAYGSSRQCVCQERPVALITFCHYGTTEGKSNQPDLTARAGREPRSGPFKGVPEHLRIPVTEWLTDVLRPNSKYENKYALKRVVAA
jgi:hypothetical protein